MLHLRRAAPRRWCAWWNPAGGSLAVACMCCSGCGLVAASMASLQSVVHISSGSLSTSPHPELPCPPAPQHHLRMGGRLPRRGGAEPGGSGRPHFCGAPAHSGPQARQVGWQLLGHWSCQFSRSQQAGWKLCTDSIVHWAVAPKRPASWLLALCSGAAAWQRYALQQCSGALNPDNILLPHFALVPQPTGAGSCGGLTPGAGGAVQPRRPAAPVWRRQPQHPRAEPGVRGQL